MNGDSGEGAEAVVVPTAAPASIDLVRVRSSAGWFFWIAGLSIVNSVIAHTGGEWSFLTGLGVTQLADAIVRGSGGAGVAMALIFDALVAGACVVLGLLARRPLLWPFGVGMVLYFLDALLLVWARDWVSVAFHAFVLFQLSVGFRLLQSAKGAAEGQ